MHIIENCWDDLNASECDFGAHIYQNSVAKIYVNRGLDVSSKLLDIFDRKNEGFAGHCALVFYGVRELEFVIREYERKNENILWKDPISVRYEGDGGEGLKKYYMGGGLYGFSASVSIVVEAERFVLHILKEDEPK